MNFKVVVQKPSEVTYDLSDGAYDMEKIALDPIGAVIQEIDAKTEEEFIEGVRDADALIARGRTITKKIIQALDNCKVIALGSVGADSVDVEIASEKGIPLTNVHYVFIEEVADHSIIKFFTKKCFHDKNIKPYFLRIIMNILKAPSKNIPITDKNQMLKIII